MTFTHLHWLHLFDDDELDLLELALLELADGDREREPGLELSGHGVKIVAPVCWTCPPGMNSALVGPDTQTIMKYVPTSGVELGFPCALT